MVSAPVQDTDTSIIKVSLVGHDMTEVGSRFDDLFLGMIEIEVTIVAL